MPLLHHTLLHIQLSLNQKLVLTRLAKANGLSMSGVVRQLIFQEHRKHTHRKRLATHRTRVARSGE